LQEHGLQEYDWSKKHGKSLGSKPVRWCTSIITAPAPGQCVWLKHHIVAGQLYLED
jgi:hypothetical protein